MGCDVVMVDNDDDKQSHLGLETNKLDRLQIVETDMVASVVWTGAPINIRLLYVNRCAAREKKVRLQRYSNVPAKSKGRSG